MRAITIAAATALAAGPAFADYAERRAEGTVAEVADRLVAAIEDAGATVFARVDHGGGAADAGLELRESEVVIFGNPQIGTPVMQADIRAGLHLPLSMLVYRDAEGVTMITWEEIPEAFDGLDVDDDLPVFERMEDALETFAEAAAAD